jgi:hypothetical protein
VGEQGREKPKGPFCVSGGQVFEQTSATGYRFVEIQILG